MRSEGLGLKLLHYHFYICNNCITLYILTFSFSFFKIYFSHSLLMQPSILPLHCCSYSYPSSISTAICQRVCCWFFLFFVFFLLLFIYLFISYFKYRWKGGDKERQGQQISDLISSGQAGAVAGRI